MQSKKRGSILLVLVVISIIGISLVSANWFTDLFKIGKSGEGLEGELPTYPATARVNITGAAAPPIIWFVSTPNSTTLYAAQSSLHKFSFIACSIGGEIQLPGTQSEVDTRVNGTFIGTVGPTPNTVVPPVSCAYEGGSIPTPPGLCGGQTSRNYSCTVRLYYYYDNGTWIINASVKDDQGRLAVNRSQTFSLDALSAWERSPTYVNWTTVELGAPPTASNNNMTIILQGNQDINNTAGYPLEINATLLMLNGIDPTQNITGDYFNSSSVIPFVNPCRAGTQLSTNNKIVIPFAINHKLSTIIQPINNTLQFCLDTTRLAGKGIGAGIYETGAERWTIYAL